MSLKELYVNEIRSSLQKEFDCNISEVPTLEKIVINMGVGEAAADSKHASQALEELELITGQKPILTKAKVSNASFKIREGNPIGVKVTLRRDNLWNFLEKLISISLPRVRDFRGLPKKSFDGRGNYSFGIKEQLIFPEIDFDKISTIRGMDITLVTTTDDNAKAEALLRALGLPIKK